MGTSFKSVYNNEFKKASTDGKYVCKMELAKLLIIFYWILYGGNFH